MLSGWSLQQTMSLDKHLAAEYRRRTLNNRSYQEESLFQPAESGGLGFRRLSSVIQDRKKSIVDRLRDSPRLGCMAVSEMLERSRLPRDVYKTVVLWGDSLMAYVAASSQRLRPPAAILDRGLDLSLVDFLGKPWGPYLLAYGASDLVATVYRGLQGGGRH